VAEEAAQPQGVDLVFKRDSQPAYARVDPVRLQQALINLISNAVEASQPDDQVTVETRSAENGVFIRVLDQGPGVPKEKREEIFQPFITGKKEGTGLGLATTRKIVVAHGGWLTVEDNIPRGAVFSIWLPKA
jgi:signal transduction histidine kinase